MYIDTHCHISYENYEDVKEVIREAKEAGAFILVASGCTRKDIDETLFYTKEFKEVYATLGYHPEEAGLITEQDLLLLKEKLSSFKVVGVGEIGLDYHYQSTNKKQQLELFERQLELASELHLPVVIHSRDATQDTIETLKKYSLKGIIHCFSGSLETAKIYQSMGYFLGIGGVVTFKNSHLPEVIEHLPLSSIVLETDSPYLAPVPYRGMQNSSKNIPKIVEKLAEIKKISTEEVEKVTTQNAIGLFDFPKNS